MRYLIIGASGFIGSEIYDYCVSQHLSVYGTFFKNRTREVFHYFDQTKETLEEVLHSFGINDSNGLVVVFCGAIASIDYCKANEVLSHRINVKATEKMIDEAVIMGAKIVFLSSEAVFDGKQGMYKEDEKTNPITLYGRQKVEVEEYLQSVTDNYLIFRVSRAVSSVRGYGDIFDEFSSKIKNGIEIVCLKDQSFNPTDVKDIARCIVLSCERNLYGLYHLANRDYCTRAELAKKYSRAVLNEIPIVVEREYSDIPFIDNRHVYGGLKADRVEKKLGISFKSLDQILIDLRNDYLK